MVSFDAFDVVVVPFPFTDRATTRRRPALVLSSHSRFNGTTGQAVMSMITSARNSDWPLDTEIHDLGAAGLPSPSIVRMKLFTLDARFILRKAGHLERDDQDRVCLALKQLMPGLAE